MTEQGEVAFARYGDPDVAWHHLEQLARAVAAAPGGDEVDPADRFVEEIAEMRVASEDAVARARRHRGLRAVRSRTVTPIGQIASLPIASRPVSRTATVEDLDALRAIPWVFSWAQARVNLPGWYGLGTGLQAVASRRGGLGRLRRMRRAWPFLAVLLENAELSLAKADRGLAARYLARGDRARPRGRDLRGVGPYRATAPGGHPGRSRARPPSVRCTHAIDLRAPYVDALSFLQLRFLDDPRATRLVQATIGGVAAGMQNTG